MQYLMEAPMLSASYYKQVQMLILAKLTDAKP
jgi:hypothetical protein